MTVLVAGGGQSKAAIIGEIIPYAGSSPPPGFLVADGATFDPGAYPELFGLTGSTTLPDLRNRTIIGTNPLGLGTDNGTSVALNYIIKAEADAVSAVPEPSSLAVFGMGACVVGIAAALRRRREPR